MRGITKACVLLATVAVVLDPAQARADGYVNPWLGVNALSGNDGGNITFGVTTGYMGAGVFGFEADLGYSPHFFTLDNGLNSRTGVTIMGDAILGIPIGGTHGAGIRPFVSSGIGLIRTMTELQNVNDVSSSTNSFGWNAGIGMMGFFNDHVGLRGDLRYFRTFEDSITGIDLLNGGRLRFWRFSGGVTFR